jgi:hypothetical protein
VVQNSALGLEGLWGFGLGGGLSPFAPRKQRPIDAPFAERKATIRAQRMRNGPARTGIVA